MRSLQYKLVSLLLLTSTLPLVILGVISVLLLGRISVYEARRSIDSNLNIALRVYDSVKENLKYATRDQNRRISTLIMEDQMDLLRNEYGKIVETNKFDFFIITDAGGKVIVSMTNPALEGYNFSRDILIKRAMRGQVSVCAEEMAEYELSKFGLLNKAKIPGVFPTDGLLIRTTQPLINTNEIIIGTITAGYLVNNDSSLIINSITAGTDFVSSMFLGGVRVASNVPSSGNAPVLGSALPEEVSARVLSDGQIFIGKAMVAGQWYLSGYAPILDITDKPVGVLGIGIPQKNIYALRDRLLYLFVTAVALSVVLSLIFGLRKGAHIVKAVRKLRSGIAAFGSGDLDYRIIDVSSGDEIEDLADFFNQTMIQLQLTKKELEQSSRKVERLTDAVSRSTAQLEEAHKQLLEYERMAAMGRMATVINHELRNIFSQIQAGLFSLKAIAGKDLPQAQVSINEIETGLMYANEVLSNVLRLSYPKRLIMIDVEVDVLIDELLKNPKLNALAKENSVKFAVNIAPRLPAVKADGMQLREVLLILATNGVQAMPDGGTLGIDASLEGDKIRIDVSDTGEGIAPNILENLFTPFLTTKHRGLGLGLCISKEVVKAHQGTIEVSTETGKGATFTIRLPIMARSEKGQAS